MASKDLLQRHIAQLNESITSFDRDPADTDYQRGYLAAMQEARRMARDLVPAQPAQ